MAFSRVAQLGRLALLVVLLIAGSFSSAAASTRNLQGKDDGDGFVVYAGLKCEDKSGSYYTKKNVDNIEDCIKLCKSDKHEDKCALVQYQVQNSKCTLWEEGECIHLKEPEYGFRPGEAPQRNKDFVMAGKVDKKTKYFHVPRKSTTLQGFDCDGKILKRLKDLPLQRCLNKCKKNKRCVAVNRWNDYGLEDFMRCTLYKTCNKGSECVRCGETYIRET